MWKVLLASGLILALSGCTTLTKVGDNLCKNRYIIEPILQAKRAEAMTIADPLKRQAEVSAFDVGLAAFDRCGVG